MGCSSRKSSRPFSSPLDRRKRGESEFGLSPPGRPAFSSASGRRQALGGGGNLVLLWRVDSRSCFCRIGFLAVAVFGELAAARFGIMVSRPRSFLSEMSPTPARGLWSFGVLSRSASAILYGVAERICSVWCGGAKDGRLGAAGLVAVVEMRLSLAVHRSGWLVRGWRGKGSFPGQGAFIASDPALAGGSCGSSTSIWCFSGPGLELEDLLALRRRWWPCGVWELVDFRLSFVFLYLCASCICTVSCTLFDV